MYFAFNLGALFLAAGLAQNGLTQTPPSPVPDVSAIFEGLIPPVKVLGNAIASFASGGNPGTLTLTLVCLTPVGFFPNADLRSLSLGSLH